MLEDLERSEEEERGRLVDLALLLFPEVASSSEAVRSCSMELALILLRSSVSLA